MVKVDAQIWRNLQNSGFISSKYFGVFLLLFKLSEKKGKAIFHCQNKNLHG